MKFAHTFWSKPFLRSKFNAYQTLLPVILSDYAYSCACVKKFGHTIELYTDDYGKELLSFIPYDKVIVLKDLDDESVDFAAQIKIRALKQMSLDTHLIDGDLFIQSKECFDLIAKRTEDFIYSFDEPNSFIMQGENMSKYKRMYSVFSRHKDLFVKPFEMDTDLSALEWPNTSFMKFNNAELKKAYIEQYEMFKEAFKEENFKDTWPDIIIEQRNMRKLLDAKHYTSYPIITGFPSPEANDYAIKLGFTHLGAGKVRYKHTIFNRLQKMNAILCHKTIEQINKYKQRP